MLDKNHVMIDLETMGNDNDAVICSIAAVGFGKAKGLVGTAPNMEFYQRVNWSIPQPGRSFTPSTVHWWLKQDCAAQDEITEPANALNVVLKDLREFLKGIPDVRVWGNGATFDISILTDAFKKEQILIPWEYRNVRDLRTLREVSGVEKYPPFIGSAHNALDDARFQIACVEMYMEALRAVPNG